MWQQGGTKSLCGFMHTDTTYLTAAATGSYQIDTLGFDYATIDVILSNANTTSNAPTVVKLGEADITTTSTSNDIIAFTGKTATATNVGFLIPVTGINTTVTGTQGVYRFNLDLRARKRYLTVFVVPVTTVQAVVACHLGMAESVPINATGAGCQTFVEG